MAFVFNRETGESLFPIEERPVPTDGIPNEQVSPTQPFTVKPPPLVRQTLSPDDAWGFTFFDRNFCRKRIASLRHGNMYEPPSLEGTIMYPQVGGGSNWGGGAFDPQRNLLITPVSQIPYCKIAAGRRADAVSGLHWRNALCARAGSVDVAILCAVYRAAMEYAGRRRYGRGRDQMESAVWRVG
jgi:glucose dehydrogenase